MKISILIPCYNEEKSIRKSVKSLLNQTRKADQIVVVDDCSTDATPEILKTFKNKIQVVRPERNTGNKSNAQEFGLKFIKGDVFIATDGDTILDPDFIKRIEEDFEDPEVKAVGGYVRSIQYNWLTACRALDYTIGQNLNKLAQDYVNYMMVIPGAAGAFRTDVFKTLGFDHDTLTEDLDFTYKLHKAGYKIKYDRDAICYTQDPSDLSSYINQMRRWFGGGWQNLMKHLSLPDRPGMALQLSLSYFEGFLFSALIFLLPLINIVLSLFFLLTSLFVITGFSIFGAIKEKRTDFFFILPHYVFIQYVNAWIYLETFFTEVVLKRKNMVWFKPERIRL